MTPKKGQLNVFTTHNLLIIKYIESITENIPTQYRNKITYNIKFESKNGHDKKN